MSQVAPEVASAAVAPTSSWDRSHAELLGVHQVKGGQRFEQVFITPIAGLRVVVTPVFGVPNGEMPDHLRSQVVTEYIIRLDGHGCTDEIGGSVKPVFTDLDGTHNARRDPVSVTPTAWRVPVNGCKAVHHPGGRVYFVPCFG